MGASYLFKGKIRVFLDYFIQRVDEWGPWGYVAYGVLYTLLEVLALPAIPLTMTSGVLFGIVPGTIVVSGASTAAATIAFLIARYAARDKVTMSCSLHTARTYHYHHILSWPNSQFEHRPCMICQGEALHGAALHVLPIQPAKVEAVLQLPLAL